jgi:NAD(P)-dependent dehydrogenase (short-subunit alcohol dehydrogenase family)
VANAGYGKRVSNILDLDLDEWDYTINVNLRSSFIITKLAVPHMQEQGWGRVIYISSIAAGGTSINGCHYSASKGKLGFFQIIFSVTDNTSKRASRACRRTWLKKWARAASLSTTLLRP